MAENILVKTDGELELAKPQLDNNIGFDIPNLADNFQKIDDGHTGLKQSFEAHKNASLPHLFSDGISNFRYGLAQENDRLKFVYEEVV